MSSEQALREQLLGDLTEQGSARSSQWQDAVSVTARHEFLRGGFFRRVEDSAPTAWEPVMPDHPEWLTACYRNESLVTQIAGTIVPGDVRGQILREPTSSSTVPGLVVRMLEDLQVEDGMRVLEIGTGTGYSTALLCQRLGDDLVTSVEVDPGVSARAAIALAQAGHVPYLVTGDGLAGHKDDAPYDRIIATCGVLGIPVEWIAQTRPGGQILATLCGWMGSSELARLTVQHDGSATGRLLGGQVSFMLARPQLPPAFGLLPDTRAGESRETSVSPDVLDDWTARFVAQIAAPRAQRLLLGEAGTLLLDVDAEAWALLYREDDAWRVRQGGPARLWDNVEEHVERWCSDGSPALDRFRVTISADGQQTITWSGTDD
ncbi:ATP-grasp peptide maturase system methyltransferase [Streptomyces sp. MI02-7b]|uniref:ATP-grasp peptide maturase system methyltransferase n=1 Tax=Streptomyces sp. MI02-7b TaxID=462941 RepID=UPI0029B1396D|nr:ATP-grasp peptide maturase system methyltransferase [Streptomyces sp. MI02-7b]MDX3078621.1 ATP-grasp peptide maturase system methyltransferase [Streptomyces sp. MI02-7b]